MRVRRRGRSISGVRARVHMGWLGRMRNWQIAHKWSHGDWRMVNLSALVHNWRENSNNEALGTPL